MPDDDLTSFYLGLYERQRDLRQRLAWLVGGLLLIAGMVV